MWAWNRSVPMRVKWCLEAFSIPALVKTWFSPYKQTYNGGGKGPIDLKVQAAVDNFISRVIGTLARTLIILAGFLCVVLSFISGVVIVVIWPFIPLLPAIGILFSFIGVGA